MALTFMQGLATPQFPGGPPPQTVDHWSFGMGLGSPTYAMHPHEHGSRYTLHSTSEAHGPSGGGGSDDCVPRRAPASDLPFVQATATRSAKVTTMRESIA